MVIASGNDAFFNDSSSFENVGQIECENYCAMAKGCEYWTYHMPSLNCFLKSSDTDKANVNGWITGNKACGTKSIKMNSSYQYISFNT